MDFKFVLLTLVLSIFLIACTSTGVIPMDKGTYMIGKRSAQMGFGPPEGTKADVYIEANEFCAKNQKTVKTINLKMVDSGFARPGSVELTFSCE
ncbi:MAG: hypothetical protein OEZ58_11475 [Gammaproteobacteria bacterium]|nr:hypothetical protein [Gammaproteobacteria bacterium]